MKLFKSRNCVFHKLNWCFLFSDISSLTLNFKDWKQNTAVTSNLISMNAMNIGNITTGFSLTKQNNLIFSVPACVEHNHMDTVLPILYYSVVWSFIAPWNDNDIRKLIGLARRKCDRSFIPSTPLQFQWRSLHPLYNSVLSIMYPGNISTVSRLGTFTYSVLFILFWT